MQEAESSRLNLETGRMFRKERMRPPVKEFARTFGIFFLFLDFSSAIEFTPLEIDNHPCTPQNLKVSTFMKISDIHQYFDEKIS